MQTFPNYHLWVALLNQRDNGTLTVLLMAAVVVLFLLDGRFFDPKRMAIYRVALVVGFYLSLVVLVIRGFAI